MVKNGYKQTEIGIVPIEWSVSDFGSKVKIYRGGSPRPIQDYLTQAQDGINWIKIGDVREGKKYITSTEEKIIPAGVARSRTVHAGDFILSNSMSFGRPYILNIDGCIHDGWLTIQEYEKTFLKNFLYYLLSSDSVYQQYISMAAGSSVKNLNKEKVSALVVAYPDIEEQERIADVLSNIDSLIAALEKQISKKKAIKQGAMQELLTGKRRLPGFSGEWENIVLGAVSSFYSGGTPSKKREDWWDGNIPWISSSDLTEDAITTVNINRYISQDAVEHSATRICPKEAVLIVSRVGVGKVAVTPCELCTSQDFTTIVSSRHNPYFLAYMLLPTMKELAMQAQGTSIKGVTVEDIQKIKMPTPTIDEQNQIVNILANMDSEIEALNQKLSKYRQVKQGMMQQLLTGKIRLKNDVADSVQVEQVVPAKTSPTKPAHNHQFDDAVSIAAIVDDFYSDKYPLGRVKIQKLLYFLHRHKAVSVSDFKKKVAGPYADTVRYKGGEPIAKKNKYIVSESSKQGTRYSKGENMARALDYVERWGMQMDLQWLKENFLHTSRNDLELFATVDMAMCDLDEAGIAVSVESIKNLIASNKEWKAKLSKTHFSDWDIARAIKKCTELFS